jgi:type IV pilus assembly protein PilC
MAVGQKVRDGSSLSEQLAKEGIFPILVSEMSKIGEETGNMPEVFEKVSAYYRKELSTKVERLVTLFEPLMIVFMGFVIGSIVISLFLPLFKISTLGGGG